MLSGIISLTLLALFIIGSIWDYSPKRKAEFDEAARIDGANPPRRFWHITLPGLSPVILFNVVVGVIGALQVFALPYVMWRGERGPKDSTYFYTSYLYDNAFKFLKMGYASAMAVTLSAPTPIARTRRGSNTSSPRLAMAKVVPE